MQVAEPMELYNHPANLFVAGFIGSPQMNFIHGTIQRDNGNDLSFVENNSTATPVKIPLNGTLAAKAASRVGQPIILGIRPENVRDATDTPGATRLHVEVAEPMGAETFLYLTSGAHTLIARVSPNLRFEPESSLSVAFDLGHAHLFDPATENAL